MEDLEIQQKTKHNQFSPRAFFGILIALNVVVAIIFALGIYTIFEKNSDIALLAGELEIEAKKEGTSSLMKRTLEDTISQREKLDSYFIYNEDIVGLLEDIEALGRVAGVDMSFESVVVSGEPQKQLDLQIVTEGSFRNTYYILTLLEVLPVKLSFGDVSIARSIQKDGSRGAWKGSFRITILSYSE